MVACLVYILSLAFKTELKLLFNVSCLVYQLNTI